MVLKNPKIFVLYFLVIGLLMIMYTADHAIGDFGNYYYGSKFFLEGMDPTSFYNDLHYFNVRIRDFEKGPFFENYTPVPPFSLIFYQPFTLFSIVKAKLIFNLLGLGFLSLSLYRMIRYLDFFSPWFYFLPLIFLQPLYSNFHQGQSYLLVCALLIEFFLAFNRDLKWQPALLIALLFSLKIFPAFVAVIFIFKKDWKSLGWTVLFLLIFQLVTYLVVGADTFNHYCFEIVPRLARNEITEPFGFFNQSLHVFLLNCFVFHPYLNPVPFINAPILAVGFQAIFYAVIFSFLLSTIFKSSVTRTFFAMLLVLVLVNQYSTVYGLLILLPFIFLLADSPFRKILPVAIILLVACNIPVSRLYGLPAIVQYARVWLLIIVFVLTILEFKPTFHLKHFIPLLIIFIPFSMGFLNIDPQERLNLEGRHILYDFRTEENAIKMHACLGDRDTILSSPFEVYSTDSLVVLDNGTGVMSDYKVLYKSGGHIKKCLLVNNSYLFVLTDEDRGGGLYRLIRKKLN